MKVADIPFVKYIQILQEDEKISLKNIDIVHNHIGTMHAAAQFALAETKSGLYLQAIFPEFDGKVVPLLRSSSIKYKNPASNTITAFASVKSESKEKFEIQFSKRGRGVITVYVELRDDNDVVTMQGEFVWLVQKI